MQISLKWVNELVNIEIINLNLLIEKLTLGGFEVEEVLDIKINNKQTIALDISATANRSDSLSIQGLALELAALVNQSSKVSKYGIKDISWTQSMRSISKNPLTNINCSGFIALTVQTLETLVSPKWLKDKLIASGIKPEDNLLDFQNYILLETGYPFEFYDLDKIHSILNSSTFNLELGYDPSLQIFSASNGISYEINDSIVMLKANNLPISIAGVLSSETVAYSTATKSLLIEASIFNSAKIRQQSRSLGLRTDRSARYEKGLKYTHLLHAVYRLISLLRISNPQLVCKLHTIAEPLKVKTKTIFLYYKSIKQVLGPIKKTKNINYNYILPEIITETLKRLQFQVKYNELEEFWEVTIPEIRSDDIVREIDLIEEIGRLYGFNNFVTRLPNIKKIGTEDLDYQIRKKVSSCLINLGLNELIQYSLVTKANYINNEIELLNPLGKDYSNLRSSLLPHLIQTVQENIKKGNSTLEGFEYGHVFLKSNLEIVEEQEHIGGIFGGIPTKVSWSQAYNLLNWFEAKGKIEELFQKLNLVTYWQSFTPIKENYFLHPYCTAKLYFNSGIRVGIFGQINPILAKNLNLSPDIYLFEFNFEVIKDEIQKNKLTVYQEYSLYPKIIKDLSFILKDDIPFQKLKDILYLNGTKFLIEINLLDEYRGKSIPKQHISLCLQFIFHSEIQTLESKKVDRILTNLKELLILKFNAILRF